MMDAKMYISYSKQPAINIWSDDSDSGSGNRIEVCAPIGSLIAALQDVLANWDMLSEEDKNLLQTISYDIVMVE